MTAIARAFGGSAPAGDAAGSDDQANVLDRQVRLAAQILTLANLANIASIVMTARFMIPPGPFRTAWGAAMLLVISNSCRAWYPWFHAPHRTAGRREERLLVIDVAAGGLFYGALGAHVVPELAGSKQVVLVSTIIGVIGSGAIALSTIRRAGFAWLAVTVGGLAIGFVRNGSAQLPIELVQLALYSAALAAAITYLSWSYQLRCQAEWAAERGREVVSLVLDDFEGGARDWLWQTDPAGRFVAPSVRFAESSGLDPRQIEGRTLLDLVDHEAPGAVTALRRALDAAGAFRDVVVPVRPAGDLRWWSLSGAPRPDGSWRGVGADVTESHRHDQEILRLARIDALTGLANRHTFSTELRQLVERRGHAQQIRLSIIDLDNFKTVNDTLGHPIGDQLLAEVARRLSVATDPTGLCARLGGDEFALVSVVERAEAEAWDDEAMLASVFEQAFSIDSTLLEIRGSIGTATTPDDALDADELVVLADLALYAAKEAGTGQARSYEPRLREAAEARARAQRDLRLAIAEEAFELRFQPLVAPDGRVVAFEALARWHHEEHGWIAPQSFITVAEETGLIVPLGDQLLDQALAAAATWPRHIRVAVNVSPAQLVSTAFAARFDAALARHHIGPERIDVEVTESAVIDPDARRTILELRHLGCGVAVDDFGTGYSSFAALQDLPITQLKIDRAFIGRLDLPVGNRARAIVRAIVDVTEASGLSCVAEGVETTEQRTIVEQLGCIVQGYLEARPMPAAEVPAYLAARAF